MADHDNRYEDGEVSEEQEQWEWEQSQAEIAAERKNEYILELGPESTWGAESDPHEFDFIPGYPTEMDYMNAMEADDYTHELDDMMGDE